MSSAYGIVVVPATEVAGCWRGRLWRPRNWSSWHRVLGL